MAQYLQGRPSASPDKMSGAVAAGLRFPDELGAVGEFLTLEAWEDGKKRQPGSVTVFSDEGTLKVCLNDKDTGLVAFLSGSTWLDLWSKIELALRESSLEWRKGRGGRR